MKFLKNSFDGRTWHLFVTFLQGVDFALIASGFVAQLTYGQTKTGKSHL